MTLMISLSLTLNDGKEDDDDEDHTAKYICAAPAVGMWERENVNESQYIYIHTSI